MASFYNSAMFFDTHAHLFDDQFIDPAAVVARAAAVGVTRILAVGTTVASSRACLALANSLPGVSASAGIHPNHTHEPAPGDWDEIVALASDPRVAALGETGLDKHWDFAPFELQQDYFDRHLRLSQQTKKPFITHVRDCEAEVLEMLLAARMRSPISGIMHSFTGDAAMATECVALGLHISFAGMVTYKKNDDLRAVARAIPDDRLLIETDSPYLSPHPHRGVRPNEPALVIHTAACLAEVRGISVEQLAALTFANAERLLGQVP
jgi:TatD DNase family protein